MSKNVEVNIEKLRKDLEEYFGTAMFMASPMAMFNLEGVKNATIEELILIAEKNGFDIGDYIVKS